MLRYILISLFLFPFLSATAQEAEPSSTLSADLFSLKGDQVGLFQNSVNLYTGEITFSLPLVSLPGRGGLNAGVSLSYSSAGVRQQTHIWNLEAPTSTVGLGWQLDVPKIVVDHKQTGTRHDDQFYWIEGGISNKLIQVKEENGVRYYKTKNYHFGEIIYYEIEEKWTITLQDGTRYIYGDKNSGRATVQYLVKWGNWIGNSVEETGQTRQAMQWDLSAIENRWDDAVTFTYRQINQKVGGDALSLEHTEASYLIQITNPQGQSIVLEYDDKEYDIKQNKEEYQEPHTEANEPDAYQERYEKEYLTTIRVQDAEQQERYHIELSYLTIGSGQYYKRVLSGIQNIVNEDVKLPPVEFAYHLTGEKVGLMQMVTTSQGPQVSYEHTKTIIAGSERDLTVEAPSGYAEPQTWIGPDYIIVAWREFNGSHDDSSKDVIMQLYQWEGKWTRSTINITAEYFETFSTPRYERNELVDEVKYNSIRREGSRYKQFEVRVSQDFFTIFYAATPSGPLAWSIDLYHRDNNRPGTWISQRYHRSIERTNELYTLMIGDNYVAASDNRGSLIETFTFDGNYWQHTSLNEYNSDYFYTYGNNYIIAHDNEPNPDAISIYYLDAMQQWKKGTVPSEVLFTSGNGAGSERSVWHGSNRFAVCMADDNDEFIFEWDENYRLSRLSDVLGGWGDFVPVYLSNNSIGIAQENNLKAFGYDGQSWHSVSKYVTTYKSVSFGRDFFLNHKAFDQADFNWFNPNSTTWESVALQSDAILNGFHVGANFVLFKEQFLVNKPSGWEYADYTIPYKDFPNGTFVDRHYDNSLVMLGSSKDDKVRVVHIRNGEISPESVYVLTGKSVDHFTDALKSDPISPLVGYNTVITFPASATTSAEAASLTLHKLVDNQLTGAQSAYAVTSVNIHDGFVRQPTTYHYTADNSARMTANGTSAQFNEVKVIPGSLSAQEAPYGYAKHYFFNGLSPAQAKRAFPEEGNSRQYYGRLSGLAYSVSSYDNLDQLVSNSASGWQVYDPAIQRNSDQVTVAAGYFARVLHHSQTQDGITQTVTNTYDNQQHGMLTESVSTDSESRMRKTTYRYATDFSDDSYGSNLLRELGITSPVLEQTMSVDEETIAKSEVHFTLSNWQPMPTRTVEYSAGSGRSFTTNMTYDKYGNLVEVQSADGLITAYLYGYNHFFAVAEAIGAEYSDLKAGIDLDELQNLDDSDLRTELAQARTGLPSALIVTRTFDPFYGITSETDPRGRITLTHYDDLGRLHYVEDHDGYVRQKMEYSAYQEE